MSRISTIVRLFPFGISILKPDPISISSGTSVWSEYLNSEAEIRSCGNSRNAGMDLSFLKGVQIARPASWVKLLTKPRTTALTDLSSAKNRATTGTRSVTNRWISNPASSGEIMLLLMAKEFGSREGIPSVNALALYQSSRSGMPRSRLPRVLSYLRCLSLPVFGIRSFSSRMFATSPRCCERPWPERQDHIQQTTAELDSLLDQLAVCLSLPLTDQIQSGCHRK